MASCPVPECMGSLPRDVTWTSIVGRSWGVRRKSNGTSLQEAAVSSTHGLPLHATGQRDSTSLNRCMCPQQVHVPSSWMRKRDQQAKSWHGALSAQGASMGTCSAQAQLWGPCERHQTRPANKTLLGITDPEEDACELMELVESSITGSLS